MIEEAVREVEQVADEWRERARREEIQSRRTRRMAVTMVLLAVLAASAAQLNAAYSSSSIRLLSRAAIRAESAADAWQHYASRRIKADLFEIQRARLARELREVLAEGGGGRAYAAELRARIDAYESSQRRYDAERRTNLRRAQDLAQSARAASLEGNDLARQAGWLQQGAAWLQGGIALVAIAIVLKNRGFWMAGILAGIAGTAVSLFGIAGG